MRIRFYIIFSSIMCAMISGLRAQNINNYAFTASSGTYVELVNPTVPPLSGGDFDEGYFSNIPVGFEFWYMGNLTTFIHASTNGVLSFSGNVPSAAAPNNTLSAGVTAFYRPFVAPLWDNLDMDSSTGAQFSYATIGTAPNRVFVAQWKNAEWNWFANTATISFQARLHETSGIIEYVYQQESGSLFSPSASIGLTGPTNTSFLSLNNSGTSPVISNSTSYNLINSKPSTGQTYTFTPPIPSTPFSLTFSNINPTNVTLNWGSASINLKYAIFKSTDNINFTYAGYSSTANYVVSGLSPNTLYYFNVYAVSEGALSVAPASGSVTTQSGAISGTITVPGNAPTITSVLDSIKTYGIGGPVFIELANGYNSSLERYPINISDTLGTSASAPLTIRPALGATDITIQPSIGLNTSYIFYLTKAKYVTLDGRPGGIGNTGELTIRSSSGFSSLIYLFSNFGNTSNVVLSYLKLKATVNSLTVSSYIGMGLYNNMELQDVEISNNEIGDSNATAYYGISLYNYNTTASAGLVIKNNRIFNLNGYGTCYGILCYGNSNKNIYITGNHIYNILPVSPISNYSNFQGISVSGGPFIISNNYIGGSDTACSGAPLEVSPAASNNNFVGIYANVSSGKTASIQGNKIANIFWPGTSSLPFSGIFVEGGGSAYIGDTIPNIIGDSSASTPSIYVLSQTSITTPAVYGIRFTGTGLARIKNNIISGINGVGTNSTYPCSVVGVLSTNSYNVDISSNLIGSRLYANSFKAASPSSTYPQSAIGILVSALGSGTINIKDNTICNLVNSGLSNSLSNYACGIHLTSAGTSQVSGNNLSKIYTASGNPTSSGVASGVGIYYNTTSGMATISRNLIHTLRSTNTSAPSVLHGININSTSGSNIQVDANFIHSFSSATSSISGALVGINIQDGVISATNNMIRLGIDNNGSSVTNSIGMIGINKITGYTTYIYNNSVYIGGSASNNSLVNTYAFRKVNDGSDEVKNNVFINARTNTSTGGKHYAMALNSINNFSSNNNLFFTPGTGGRLFLNGSAEYTTRGAWFLATNLDDNSDSSSVPFINATGDAASVDLHLAINTPTKAEGNGTTSITTNDFDGQLRSSLTPNDIGADADNFIKIGITPAPVIWMWVKASKAIYDCHVKWMVALENNNNFFTVERSFDGISYQEVGKVKGAGNRNVRTLYEFNDKGVYNDYREVVYYRIVQYDFDGRFSYSQVVALYTSALEFDAATIYPNPAKEGVKIALPQMGYAKSINITIVTPDGKKYLDEKIPFSTEVKVNTASLPQGVYFVTIKVDEQKEIVKKLTIQ